ncbi:hypothetical protein F4782DRAFT_527007 [Xylaria castorea]|nr:hypothetical protein F4782DRAFT_527007 [Xylaria castorea]
MKMRLIVYVKLNSSAVADLPFGKFQPLNTQTYWTQPRLYNASKFWCYQYLTTSHSTGNKDSGSTLDHRPEHHEDYSSDDDIEDDFDPHDIIYSTTQQNSASSVLSRKQKALPVNSGTGPGIGGYGEYAIMWICNCGWRKNRPVNCWELNEALRLLEDKCGPGQGGIVRLHGKREIGLGSLRKLEDIAENNRAASVIYGTRNTWAKAADCLMSQSRLIRGI